MNFLPNNNNQVGLIHGIANNAHVLEHAHYAPVPNHIYSDDDFNNDINADKSQKISADIRRLEILLPDLINTRVQWLKPIR